MVRKWYEFTCDMCGYKETCYLIMPNIYQTLRSAGWTVSRDRVWIACPKCASKSRSPGRNGNKILQPLKQKREERLRKIEEEFRREFEETF